MGKSLGVSYHTATSYLNYLEQAYLIRRVHPYHDNLKKRLTKSPKVYWRDSGLLHSLLRIGSFDELISRSPDHIEGDKVLSTNLRMFLKHLEAK